VTSVTKVGEAGQPNIVPLLRSGTIDCVINILVGDDDYDAASDSKRIRSMATAAEIPLFTEVESAEQKLSLILKSLNSRSAPIGAADLRSAFLRAVTARGGFANHHGHFDKAFLISPENLDLSQKDMQKKWYLYRYLKENYTYDDLYSRMSRCIELLIAQGCRYTRTMVDADSIVKTLPLKVAVDLKRAYADTIQIEIGVQPLEGVVDPNARKFFEQACEMADFVGGLPSRDRPQPELHLDIIFSIAKSLGKRVDVHVDQENNPDENESELLAIKTMQHGLEGRVFGVHAVSLAAKSDSEQTRVIKMLKDAGIGIICCPSAALSMKALDKVSPIHNSIVPVPKLLAANIPVYLGVDNIADLFMPLVDADLWTECRILMEACRFYDLNAVADIATRRLPD
jgi:cytosine/adenosine deaminase-related metal-dependent hydrolase